MSQRSSFQVSYIPLIAGLLMLLFLPAVGEAKLCNLFSPSEAEKAYHKIFDPMTNQIPDWGDKLGSVRFEPGYNRPGYNGGVRYVGWAYTVGPVTKIRVFPYELVDEWDSRYRLKWAIRAKVTQNILDLEAGRGGYSTVSCGRTAVGTGMAVYSVAQSVTCPTTDTFLSYELRGNARMYDFIAEAYSPEEIQRIAEGGYFVRSLDQKIARQFRSWYRQRFAIERTLNAAEAAQVPVRREALERLYDQECSPL